MSSTSFSIALLLLFVAIYSCNARPIGAINKQSNMAKNSHFSSKNEEKSSLARVSVSSNEKPSIQNKSEAPKEGLNSPAENGVNENNQGRKAQKLAEKKDEVKDGDHDEKIKDGDDDHAVQTESIPTVSWMLPHRKREEPQPGFNLDYDPPQTHPPVHN